MNTLPSLQHACVTFSVTIVRNDHDGNRKVERLDYSFSDSKQRTSHLKINCRNLKFSFETSTKVVLFSLRGGRSFLEIKEVNSIYLSVFIAGVHECKLLLFP